MCWYLRRFCEGTWCSPTYPLCIHSQCCRHDSVVLHEHTYMQASSAQLCQDVCGAFDGLPLHGSPVSDPIEGAHDQDSLDLTDLHELGLLSNGASHDFPPHGPNTEQQQQQHGPFCRATVAGPDGGFNLESSSNVSQQHCNSPQLEVQHGCSTSSCEHLTDDRQGTKGNTAGRNPAHRDAVLDKFTITQAAPYCSVPQAAQKCQHQSELPLVPDRSTQQAIVERDKHDSSRGSLSRQFPQPVMSKGGAAMASEELLKAAGEKSSLYMQMRIAHPHQCLDGTVTHGCCASNISPASFCMLAYPALARAVTTERKSFVMPVVASFFPAMSKLPAKLACPTQHAACNRKEPAQGKPHTYAS